jgi:hypothetical protein
MKVKVKSMKELENFINFEFCTNGKLCMMTDKKTGIMLEDKIYEYIGKVIEVRDTFNLSNVIFQENDRLYVFNKEWLDEIKELEEIITPEEKEYFSKLWKDSSETEYNECNFDTQQKVYDNMMKDPDYYKTDLSQFPPIKLSLK